MNENIENEMERFIQDYDKLDNLEKFIYEYNKSRIYGNNEKSKYCFIQVCRIANSRKEQEPEIIQIKEKYSKMIEKYKFLTINEMDNYISLLSEYIKRKKDGKLSEKEYLKRYRV